MDSLDSIIPMLWVFDSVESSQIPPGAQAFAGYVDGFVSYYGMRQRFPHAIGIPITVHGNTSAHVADVEPGAMSFAQGIEWARHRVKPVFYVSVSNQYALERALQRAGHPRSSYRIWAAHWTGYSHICSEAHCGYPMMAPPGMTQFIGNGWRGYNVDVSVASRAWLEAVASGH